MNIAFCTCVQLGLSCIEEIYKIGGDLKLLITLKDEKAKDKSGRVYLDDIANEHHVPLLKINSINDAAAIDAIREYRIDWLFIIGWSQIAKSEVLNAPAKGCIGMHPTLLPKGRGRASIPWAILKGLDRTGVSMFKLDEGVDTGDILGQGIIKMHEDITASELYEIFSDMTMMEADRMVRAVTHPYPGAFHIADGKKMIIWSASVSAEEGRIKLKDGYLTPIAYEIVDHE
jgi:methionyl-tRNA formyltransferase